MKNGLWFVLVAAAAAGGFFAGGMARRPSSIQLSAEVKSSEPKEAARLADAGKRIAQLEKDLAAARRDVAKFRKKCAVVDSLGDSRETAQTVVKVGKEADIMGELKNKLPDDQFEQVTNAFSQLRTKLEQLRKGRQEYLASVDTSAMSARERENHRRFQELLAKREAISAKMKGVIPDVASIEELVKLGMELEPAAKEERSTLVRQVARELGYTGDDVEVIHDTMKSIFDCTSTGGIGGFGDITEAVGGMGGGAPGVKIETQVIGL